MVVSANQLDADWFPCCVELAGMFPPDDDSLWPDVCDQSEALDLRERCGQCYKERGRRILAFLHLMLHVTIAF